MSRCYRIGSLVLLLTVLSLAAGQAQTKKLFKLAEFEDSSAVGDDTPGIGMG